MVMKLGIKLEAEELLNAWVQTLPGLGITVREIWVKLESAPTQKCVQVTVNHACKHSGFQLISKLPTHWNLNGRCVVGHN